jgi:hypothetical protein
MQPVSLGKGTNERKAWRRYQQLNDLTDEQKAKAMVCKTPEEILALAKDEGLELSDEMLDAVAGGSIPGWMSPYTSASCGNYDVIR